MLVINPIQLEGSLVVIEPLQPEHEAELQHVGRATRTHNVLFVESVPPMRERYASICVWSMAMSVILLCFPLLIQNGLK